MAAAVRKGTIRVFVYGTLKRLHSNHRLLESNNITDTEYLGRARIIGPYRMLDLGNFPGVQETTGIGNKAIYGEVYAIGPNTLEALDILEGNGNFYTRHKVVTAFKNAWMYFLPPDDALAKRYAVIESGVWRPTKLEQDFVNRDVEFENDIPIHLIA